MDWQQAGSFAGRPSMHVTRMQQERSISTRHDPSRYMPPAMYSAAAAAAVPCGAWNPPAASTIANGVSSDAGFQCRFRWLMNQLLICFWSSPVVSASASFSVSCVRNKTFEIKFDLDQFGQQLIN